MKNLTALISRADIHDWARSTWKSQPFQDSYAAKGFIYDQVERFSWMPRLTAEMTNDHLERSHFSTWWNVIMIRDDYTNPIIHDLYYLHEMAHAASMPYVPDIGREAFNEKMQRNELEASTLSEVQVYFEMPGLREASFDYPIYADRFLEDPFLGALWEKNPVVAVETMRTMRRHVMVSKPEHTLDEIETWIRRFAEQNAIYAITWSDRYNEIEQQMALFQNNVMHHRKDAIALLHLWLETEAQDDPTDNIPFRQEAELFSGFYWANKEKYAAAVAM